MSPGRMAEVPRPSAGRGAAGTARGAGDRRTGTAPLRSAPRPDETRILTKGNFLFSVQLKTGWGTHTPSDHNPTRPIGAAPAPGPARSRSGAGGNRQRRAAAEPCSSSIPFSLGSLRRLAFRRISTPLPTLPSVSQRPPAAAAAAAAPSPLRRPPRAGERRMGSES